MKTIGTFLFASVIGLNIFNYNNPGREITIDYILQPKQKPAVDASPAPSTNYLDTVVVKPTKAKRTAKSYSKQYQPHIDYINKYMRIAKEIEVEYQIPAYLVIAQGIMESGAGTSWLGRNANNHHGIKAGSSKKYVQGSSAKWRKFDSPEESFRCCGKTMRNLHNILRDKHGIDTVNTFTLAISNYAGKDEYLTIKGKTYHGNFSYMHAINSIINKYNLIELCKNYSSQ